MSQSALPKQRHLNLRCLQNWSICLPIRRSSSVFVYTLWCANIVILVIPLLEVENLQLSHHQRYFRWDIPAKLPVWKRPLSFTLLCHLMKWSCSTRGTDQTPAVLHEFVLCTVNLPFDSECAFWTISSDQRHLSTRHPTANNPHSVSYRYGFLLYEANMTDSHADSCRRMRIVWWSSAGRFCTWFLVLLLNFICILLVFPSTYFKWPDLWRLLISEVTNLTSIFRPTGSAKSPSMSETL